MSIARNSWFHKYEGKLVGILGTVIIHLTAAILFMSFKFYSLKKALPDEFTVEFAQVKQAPEEKKLIELPASNVEKVLQGDQELLNIAKNLAGKADVKVDAKDYINEVKNELIREGKLGHDNFIDEQSNPDKIESGENLSFQGKTAEDEEKPKESQKMAANYKGPTRIFYDLEGRTQTYLPLPIYKCEGSGTVVLEIKVDQQGIVEEARVVSTESAITDPCLTDTAVSTALISRFSPDINAPRIQVGTLTYEFVAQ